MSAATACKTGPVHPPLKNVLHFKNTLANAAVAANATLAPTGLADADLLSASRKVRDLSSFLARQALCVGRNTNSPSLQTPAPQTQKTNGP
ncbi:MAG: hypothetical protein Q4A28_03555 [Brachymonas sp.]|nr:hypothetical protein [Brachymonas sp.]